MGELVMKKLKYSIVYLWIIIAGYLLYNLPKNIFYLLIAFPLFFGGAFIIIYLFERVKRKK